MPSRTLSGPSCSLEVVVCLYNRLDEGCGHDAGLVQARSCKEYKLLQEVQQRGQIQHGAVVAAWLEWRPELVKGPWPPQSCPHPRGYSPAGSGSTGLSTRKSRTIASPIPSSLACSGSRRTASDFAPFPFCFGFSLLRAHYYPIPANVGISRASSVPMSILRVLLVPTLFSRPPSLFLQQHLSSFLQFALRHCAFFVFLTLFVCRRRISFSLSPKRKQPRNSSFRGCFLKT